MPASAPQPSAGARGLFSTTADFYQRYRSGISSEVAELLLARTPKRRPRRLLDVGTGSGFVIQSLLPEFDEAIGVDPDADLLAVAREQLRSAKNVRLISGSAEDFVVQDGWLADLVTVCRAYHWFNGPLALAHITKIMAPGAVIAILGDQSIWAGGDEWKERSMAVVGELLGPARRAGTGNYIPTDRVFTEELTRAGFRDVASDYLPVQRVRSVESVIGLLHSMSFASPAVLGDQLEAFDERIRDAITPLTDDTGSLIDHNEFYVYSALRP